MKLCKDCKWARPEQKASVWPWYWLRPDKDTLDWGAAKCSHPDHVHRVTGEPHGECAKIRGEYSAYGMEHWSDEFGWPNHCGLQGRLWEPR